MSDLDPGFGLALPFATYMALNKASDLTSLGLQFLIRNFW